MKWDCREFQFGSGEYRASLALREEVLRKPLGLALRPEDQAGEGDSFHLGCFAGEGLVGSLILKPVDAATLKMRQVAVATGRQGEGAGSELVRFAEEFARGKGYRAITAHAREVVLPFYVKRGYTVEGEPFVEATIPHRAIFKQLEPCLAGR